MLDPELDSLLARLDPIPEIDEAGARSFALSALATAQNPSPRPRRRRGLAALAIGAGAVALLSAGIATRDVWATMPPFVQLADAAHRTPGIRILMPETSQDPGEHCLYFVDLVGLTASQARSADDIARSLDFSEVPTDDPDALALTAMRVAVPSLSYHEPHHLPTLDASEVSCTTRYW